MRIISKQLIYSMLIFCLLLVSGGYILLAFSEIEFSLFINALHTPFLDQFFFWITLLGDGSFLLVLAFVFLFKKYYYAILSVLLLISSGLISYLFKKMIFVNSMRPLFYLSKSEIHIPEGIHFYYKNSFPSGHAMTVFAATTLIIWIYRKFLLSYMSLTIASLVCISRVYLLQHFFIDVYFGAILGVLESALFIWIIETKLNRLQNSKLNSSLYSFLITKTKIPLPSINPKSNEKLPYKYPPKN
ncbi:phosphatase PAP2 family protein [Labilibaculum sp.]|uniref:phosphatase PAP2 family protein n=1 Tax=Labilibaculum sp. TaxID=2060723 RepID=UPI002AA9242D|nr:phosphatase PAP2 family protein [Labilibaculum sp.]